MLTEHEDPYITGFILILFPTAILLFGIAFIEKYSWLRNSIELQRASISGRGGDGSHWRNLVRLPKELRENVWLCGHH